MDETKLSENDMKLAMSLSMAPTKMMPPAKFIRIGLPPTRNQVALPALVKWTSERQSLIVSVTRQVS